jgi:tetraacyldisaccharide-1-P 4'-kinase
MKKIKLTETDLERIVRRVVMEQSVEMTNIPSKDIKPVVSAEKFNTIKFPDHHGYSIDEIEALVSLEENLICTAKDLVKIPSEYQKFFIVAKLELKIINEDILINKLKNQFLDN